ncbi:MAG: DUF3795 domain-containing protein [Bacteroidia bacterium]|nr:DUF3795 domain-containing protein [Bacteroidia bacterium]
MKQVPAYCGLVCETCLVYLATREPDETRQTEMKKSIAEQCASHYQIFLKPEEITGCDGCRTHSGRLFPGCDRCKIRACAIRSGFENCAFCPGFTCTLLENHFIMDRDSKIRLEKIRQTNGQR